MKGLRRVLCVALCYGFIFSYPSWTIGVRLAQDAPEKKNGITRQPDPGEPAKAGAKAAEPDLSMENKDPAKHDNKDPKKGGPSRIGKDDKEKQPAELPDTTDCSNDNFFKKAANVGVGKAKVPVLCGTEFHGEVNEKCWTQVYLLLAGADANAIMHQNPEGDPNKKTAVTSAVENSIYNMRDFHQDRLANSFSTGPDGKSYSDVVNYMSDSEIHPNLDHQACCLQLVEKAAKVGEYIKAKEGRNEENTLKEKDFGRFDQMIAKQRDKCESSHGAVVIPPPPPKEEKKKSGIFAIIAALVVAGIIFLIASHHHKKPKRPTEKPTPCKKKGCHGGGHHGGGHNVGGDDGDGTSATTATTSNPTTNTTTTGNTYPGTDSSTGRTSTGETGGDTYPSTNGATGRDNTTGDSGTVTGSTTATNTTTSGTVTGNTYPENGGDGPARTTGGTPRSVAPKNSRTLIK